MNCLSYLACLKKFSLNLDLNKRKREIREIIFSKNYGSQLSKYFDGAPFIGISADFRIENHGPSLWILLTKCIELTKCNLESQ